MQFFLIVIVCAFLLTMTAKALFQYKPYKVSIYRGLYSNYLEYFYRYEVRQDCSKSSWLNHEIGKHRMFFSQMNAQSGEALGRFVTVIFNKGLYCVEYLNPNGSLNGKTKDKFWVVHREEDGVSKSFRIQNPAIALVQYSTHLESITGVEEVQAIIAVPNETDLTNVKSDIPVYHYKDIVNCLKQAGGTTIYNNQDIEDVFAKLKGNS